ncbi:MAG TPA: hypothetical protein VNA25_20290 [Phycisphaerae bacterium]|nr:hypothetical protein [Phycisphaerae bacterium]
MTNPIIGPNVCGECGGEYGHRPGCSLFTEEEFQNLCHNFGEDDAERFCDGCDSYQRKLFGRCRTDELLARLARIAEICERERLATQSWMVSWREIRRLAKGETDA